MNSCIKPKFSMKLREIDYECKVWFLYKKKEWNDYNYSIINMIPCHDDNYTKLCYQLFKSSWCDLTINIEDTYNILIAYTSKDCKLEDVIKELSKKELSKIIVLDRFKLYNKSLQKISKELHNNYLKRNNDIIDDTEKIPPRFKRIKIYSDDSKTSIELCFSISKTPNVLLKMDCPVYEIYDNI